MTIPRAVPATAGSPPLLGAAGAISSTPVATKPPLAPPAASPGPAIAGASALPPVPTPAPGSMGLPPGMGPAPAAPVAPAVGGGEPRIPAKVGECPKLATGNVTVLGQNVQLWVGPKSEAKTGPVFFYWHGTGSRPSEASLLGGAIAEIQQQGGLVASFDKTTMKGRNTGNNVWYTGDFEMADQILACAVEQLNIDVRRIYTGGCSAGGLQAGAMLYGRSSYLAGVMTNSGGTVFPYALEDPSHVPSLITAHGEMGRDVVGVDFSTTSATQTRDVVAKKGIAVNCDHGGGHCGAPANLVAKQWEFLKAHPFGVSPAPYAGGLPAGFPEYCKIVQ